MRHEAGRWHPVGLGFFSLTLSQKGPGYFDKVGIFFLCILIINKTNLVTSLYINKVQWENNKESLINTRPKNISVCVFHDRAMSIFIVLKLKPFV